jgi:hypothetical protein
MSLPESARQKRARIQGYLAMAERHVLEGRQQVRQQTALVRRYEKSGRDCGMAEELLRLFEETLRSHIRHRDEYRSALDQLTPRC